MPDTDTLGGLLADLNDGAIKPSDWNWCVTTSVVPNPRKGGKEFVARTCIYVMGQGAEQMRNMIVLAPATTEDDACHLIRTVFGVDRIIMGL